MDNIFQPYHVLLQKAQEQAEQVQLLQNQGLYNQAQAMGQAVGMAQARQAQQVQQAFFPEQLQAFPIGFGLGGGGGMSQPGMPHFGTVKDFRRKFKEYTKAEFRNMGSCPVIKEILSGMTKLNKEEIKDRIAEHLAVV